MPSPTDRWCAACRLAVVQAAVLLAAGCGTAPPASGPGVMAPTDSAPASTPGPLPGASAPVAVEVPPPPSSPPPPTQATLDILVDRLLAFHERFRNLPALEAAREQARLAADGGAQATLELAWALGLPQAPGRVPGDLARAQALLDPLARSDRPEAPLARLLQARLGEQRRLEEQLERQAQQQRELQRRNEQLREQLDALRAIERSLGPRPPASAPRTP